MDRHFKANLLYATSVDSSFIKFDASNYDSAKQLAFPINHILNHTQVVYGKKWGGVTEF